MSIRKNPLAVMLYDREDDEYEQGALYELGNALEKALCVVAGYPIQVFQPHAHIQPGEHKQQRIDAELADAGVLIPVITPLFVKSESSSELRQAFWRFHEQASQSGRNHLIIPIYYFHVYDLDGVKQSSEVDQPGIDPLIVDLAARQEYDWRPLRGKALDDKQVKEYIEHLARRVFAALAPAEAQQRGLQVERPSAAPSPVGSSNSSVAAVNRGDESTLTDLSGVAEYENDPEYEPYIELETVRKIVQEIEAGTGYQIIQAPPLMGKTALMLFLYRQIIDKGDLCIAYFFEYVERSDINAALKACHDQIKRLAHIHDIELTRFDDMHHNLKQISDWAQKNKRKVYILIDAIDECLSGYNLTTLAQLLPQSRPEHICFVVTTQDWDRIVGQLGKRRTPFKVHKLQSLTPNEIGFFVNEFFNRRPSKDIDPQQVIEKAQKDGEGCPAEVRAYCEGNDTYTTNSPYWETRLKRVREHLPEDKWTLFKDILAYLTVDNLQLTLADIKDLVGDQITHVTDAGEYLDDLLNTPLANPLLGKNKNVTQSYQLASPFLTKFLKDHDVYGSSWKNIRRRFDHKIREHVARYRQPHDQDSAEEDVDLPLYVLRYALERSAKEQYFVDLLTGNGLLGEFSRTKELPEGQSALERTWVAIGRLQKLEPRLTKSIACAIALASLLQESRSKPVDDAEHIQTAKDSLHEDIDIDEFPESTSSETSPSLEELVEQLQTNIETLDRGLPPSEEPHGGMTEANRLPHAITKDVDQILPLLVRVDERTIVTHLRTLLWAAALKARPYVLLIIAQFAPAIRCVVTDPNNVIEMIDRTTSAQ